MKDLLGGELKNAGYEVGEDRHLGRPDAALFGYKVEFSGADFVYDWKDEHTIVICSYARKGARQGLLSAFIPLEEFLGFMIARPKLGIKRVIGGMKRVSASKLFYSEMSSERLSMSLKRLYGAKTLYWNLTTEWLGLDLEWFNGHKNWSEYRRSCVNKFKENSDIDELCDPSRIMRW
jgi:hypothetical protein